MHQFLSDVLDLLDKVDVILVEFRLRIDDRDDSGCLRVENKPLHLADLSKDGVEVVLGHWQQVVFLAFPLLHPNTQNQILSLSMHTPQQQQNNNHIRIVRMRRFNLNAAQKDALEKVFRAELHPNFAEGEQRAMLVSGIPAEFRNYIWTQLIPNHHSITPTTYAQLMQKLTIYRTCQRADLTTHTQLSYPGKQKIQQGTTSHYSSNPQENPKAPQEDSNKIVRWMQVIAQDIPRTFPELRIFHNDNQQREKLSNILGCFAIYLPELGYIQGLSLIGALFLQELGTQYRAFTALTTLVTTTVLYDFYTFNESTRTSMSRNIMGKLQKKAEMVSSALTEMKVELEMIVVEWVMTLFCRIFQLDSILNIWDILFTHRLTPAIVEDLCVAVIVSHRQEILVSSSSAAVGKLLRSAKLTFSEEEEIFAALREVQVQVVASE